MLWAAVSDPGFLTIIGTLAGWIATVVAFGVKIGRMTERMEVAERELQRLRDWKHTRGNIEHQIGMAVDGIDLLRQDFKRIEGRIDKLEERRAR